MSTWNIDAGHSEIGFVVKHLMISKVRGMFKTFSGTLVADTDDFANAKISFETDAESVDTNNKQRDEHIKSADFFDVAQFPKLTFASTSFSKNSDGVYSLTGTLTLHGVSKEITLEVTGGNIVQGLYGARVTAFELSGAINRNDFGVVTNMPMSTGDVVIGEEVTLNLSVELTEESK
jgi:polyisoprenoid-binding protein YceI